MHLSVLDQSPVLAGASAAEALAATLELAQAADRLGFHRYWVAEHHAMAAVADPCPEILVGRIASLTQRIRVGTGGILLPYYSPLKVAESFRMLEALFPGRIDLGVGRAPGGDMRTAQALLRGGARFDPGAFPGQIEALREYLAGGETDGVYATPPRIRSPSSGCSARPATAAGSPHSSGCPTPSRTSSAMPSARSPIAATAPATPARTDHTVCLRSLPPAPRPRSRHAA